MINRKSARCIDCGEVKPAGHGELYYARGRGYVGSNGQRYRYRGEYVVFCDAAHLAEVRRRDKAEQERIQAFLDECNGITKKVEPPALGR
jgi:hypothetical protein